VVKGGRNPVPSRRLKRRARCGAWPAAAAAAAAAAVSATAASAAAAASCGVGSRHHNCGAGSCGGNVSGSVVCYDLSRGGPRRAAREGCNTFNLQRRKQIVFEVQHFGSG
jgi:hypothetical protein